MFRGYYRKYVFEKMNRLKEYIEFSDDLLKKNLARTKEDNIKFLAEIDDEFYQEKFSDIVWDREQEVEFEFSAIHWSSIFITQYSYIEHILDDICSHYRRESGTSLSHKTLSGFGIERAKEYISKHMGIKSPFGEKEWAKIKDYAKIRNKIIHTGLDINEEHDIDKTVLEIIKKTPSISLDRHIMTHASDPHDEENSEYHSYLFEPRIELNKDFLGIVIQDFEDFFDQLFIDLEGIKKSSQTIKRQKFKFYYNVLILARDRRRCISSTLNATLTVSAQPLLLSDLEAVSASISA